MRVLYVNPGGYSSGGAERSLALLIGELAARGYEAGVITLSPGDAGAAFASAGAVVVADGLSDRLGSIRRHGSTSALLVGTARTAAPAVAAARAISSHARSFAADLIHTNGLRAHLLTPILRASAPVVWSLRERPPGSAARMMVRAAARFAAGIIAPSAFAATLVSGCRRPIYIVPNPVDSLPVLDKPAARAALGLPSDRPVVAVLSHLHPTKGQHIAVEAWQRLERPRPLLLLAGGELYGQASTVYGRSLCAMIAGRDLGEDVVLLGLAPDPGQIYAACDLVLQPSLHPEGFGRSLAEAQVAGVPVIATALGAAPELIEHGGSGMLVPPGDVPALAALVERVLGDPQLRSRLRSGGLAQAARYGVQRHAASINSVYRAVTA